jgi:uncharacterized protein involved in propanediol utilization
MTDNVPTAGVLQDPGVMLKLSIDNAARGKPAVGILPELGAAFSIGAVKLTEFVENHETKLLVPAPWPEACHVTGYMTASDDVIVTDSSGLRMSKSEKLIQRILARYTFNGVGFDVRIQNPISPGKGAATSTANLRLVACVVAPLLGLTLDQRWLATQMAAIEPTDFFEADGFTCVWNFQTARRKSRRFKIPHGTYIGIIPRRDNLNTDDVDKRRPKYSTKERSSLDEIFSAIVSVLAKRDLGELARLSRRSADINARYFPNSALPALRELTRRGTLLGYAVAHSGTAALGLASGDSLVDTMRRVGDKLDPSAYDIRGFNYSEQLSRRPFLIGAGASLVYLDRLQDIVS